MSDSKTYLTMKQFLDKSITFEEESAEYYADLSAKVDDADGVKLLREIEKQERWHAETLKNYTVPEGDDSRLQFGPTLSASMPEKPRGEDVNTLLTHAIEREIKSARLYDFASDLATGAFKQLLQSLGDYERSHEQDLKLLNKRLFG